MHSPAPQRLERRLAPIDLNDQLKGRFGVVKLWPGVKAAEDEVIERLRTTAKSLGLECHVVDFKGRPVANPAYTFTQDELDFIIHLHFETPKAYDVFSFVALWNPLAFYHEWGYRKFSSHLVTHDDFLSCASPWADDQVRRLIWSRDSGHLDPEFHLFHSLSEPVFEPGPPSMKRHLFYAGINWDKLRGKSRHQEILQRLDDAGLIRIFGPTVFQGVRVWEGFKGYVGPIPFDGQSMISEIAKAGVSLVFSSQAHKESGLMSSRLFESAAAGAVIIADENPFTRLHFGDSVLYVDATTSTEEVFYAIRKHLEWIEAFPEEACQLARMSQTVFLNKFALDRSIREIYAALPQRKAALRTSSSGEPVTLAVLLPEFSQEALARHLRNIRQQDYESVDVIILANQIEEAFAKGPLLAFADEIGRCEVRFIPFEKQNEAGAVTEKVRLGKILADVIESSANELIMLLGPNEEIFSDHIRRLAAVLEPAGIQGVAASDVLLSHKSADREHIDFYDRLPMDVCSADQPFGIGRFLLRRSNLPKALFAVIPYLNALAFHALVGMSSCKRSLRPTVRVDIQHKWWVSLASSDAKKEWEILGDIGRSTGVPQSGSVKLDYSSPRDMRDFEFEQQMRSVLARDAKGMAKMLFAALPLWDVLRRPFETLQRLWLLKWRGRVVSRLRGSKAS